MPTPHINRMRSVLARERARQATSASERATYERLAREWDEKAPMLERDGEGSGPRKLSA